MEDLRALGNGPSWFDLGGVAVIPLVETAQLLIEPDEFFPQLDADRSSWCFTSPWYDRATSRLVFTIQSFLIVTPAQLVLVDACVGESKHRVRPAFHGQDDAWFAGFEATGFTAAEVSAVVFTHLHVDHVGGATRPHGRGWRAAFPGARHYVTEAEYRYWASSAGSAAMGRTGDYMADSIQPLLDRGLLEFVQPGSAIGPHVRLIPAFGHTPGNLCVQVLGAETELWIVADAVHHPVQLLRPELSTRYCVDPQQATRTREHLLARLADSGVPMLPSHFAHPSVGRITRAGAGYSFAIASDILRPLAAGWTDRVRKGAPREPPPAGTRAAGWRHSR